MRRLLFEIQKQQPFAFAFICYHLLYFLFCFGSFFVPTCPILFTIISFVSARMPERMKTKAFTKCTRVFFHRTANRSFWICMRFLLGYFAFHFSGIPVVHVHCLSGLWCWSFAPFFCIVTIECMTRVNEKKKSVVRVVPCVCLCVRLLLFLPFCFEETNQIR